MKRPTNVEFVTELMEFSNKGPIIQAYVLEALRLYSESVVANQEQIPEDGFISRAVWVGCAQEVLAKLEERNND
jgi:hypothetical protein